MLSSWFLHIRDGESSERNRKALDMVSVQAQGVVVMLKSILPSIRAEACSDGYGFIGDRCFQMLQCPGVPLNQRGHDR